MDKERLVSVLDRMFVFTDRSGEGLKSRRPPGEMLDEAEEEAPVEAIKASLINIEELEGLDRLFGTNEGPPFDLSEIPEASEEPVRDPWCPARAARDLFRGRFAERELETISRAERDLLQRGDPVELKMLDDPKSISERRGETAGRGRCADKSERGEWDLDTARHGSLPNHDIKPVVFERGVEVLFEDWTEPMDLIDKEDIPFIKLCEERCEISLSLQRGTTTDVQFDSHCLCDNQREGRFTETRWTTEETVVKRFSSLERSGDKDLKLLLDPTLPNIVFKATRTEGSVPGSFSSKDLWSELSLFRSRSLRLSSEWRRSLTAIILRLSCIF